MTVREMITQLEAFAEKAGDRADVILFDRSREEEFRVDPDADRFDFEVLRGDGEIVIEFG